MKLAVNYSPQAARLLAEGKIDIDIYKAPNLPEVVEIAKPCYVHFPFRAGRGQLGDVDWREVRQLIDASDTPCVNMHLCPCAADFPGMDMETTDPGDRACLIEAMEQDVGHMVERFGRERIILENVMWDPVPPWFVPAPALEAQVIEHVVRDTGCGFILDISHAIIAARYFEVDEKEYILALPTDQTREMHISGIRLDEQDLWQDHNPMTDYDWAMAEWAVERFRCGDWPAPWAITLEIGGVGRGYERKEYGPVLAEQVGRLAEIVESLRAV